MERNKKYAVGDIAYTTQLPAGYYLECVTAGTTGNTEPTISVESENVNDGTVKWGVKNIQDASKLGLPVGFEAFTTNPNLQAGWLPLLGGEYSRTAYADLWEWVQKQTGYLKAESEWQELAVSNSGNVPFYSKGNGTTTFRVPALKCWVRGADSISEVGGYLDAGLPNITGKEASGRTTEMSTDGAFYSKTNNDGTLILTYSGTTTSASYQRQCFDASLSNPIYGSSDTVQPPSIVGLWCVKAYGSVSNVGSADLAQLAADHTRLETIINELKNKLDKDTFFVPDYSNPVELTKDVYNTMTYDGWLMPWVQRLSNSSGTLTINIDGATIQLSANNFSIDSNFFPVKKGSVVKFVINGSVGYLKFYRKKVN